MTRYFLATLLIAASFTAQAEELKASRPPKEHCEWAPFESKELGVRLLVQKCKGDESHVDRCVFVVNKDWLEVNCSGTNPPTGNNDSLFSVLSKPGDEPIEKSINRDFMQDKELDARQRKDCKLKPFSTDYFVSDANRQLYNIVPTGKLKKLAEKSAETGKPDDSECGWHSNEGDWVKYFEYHPGETKTKYLYFMFKADDAFFYDEKSIHFLSQ